VEFIKKSSQDFITFKIAILSKETGNDPIKKAEMIKDVVHSIALIPDHITRATYLKECSALIGISETNLHNELTKVRRKNLTDERKKEANNLEIENAVDDLIKPTPQDRQSIH